VHEEDRHLVLLAEHQWQEDDDRGERAGQRGDADLLDAGDRRLDGFPGFICRWRKMLSVITTELSTSMPIASSMPIIVRMLSVNPRKYMAPA